MSSRENGSQTGGWKEYRNMLYNYKVSYPGDYILLANTQEFALLKKADSSWLVEIVVEDVAGPSSTTVELKKLPFKEFAAEKILSRTGLDLKPYTGRFSTYLRMKKIVNQNNVKGFMIDYKEDIDSGAEKPIVKNKIDCPVYAFNISRGSHRVLIFQLVYCDRIVEEDKKILERVVDSLRLMDQ